MTRGWEKENRPEIVEILGVKVTSSRLDRVIGILKEKLTKKIYEGPFFVVTVNTEFVMLAQEDEDFMRILNSADLAVADGAGLKLAGVKNVVPGRSLVGELLKLKLRTFYLGGRNGVAEAMARKYGGEWDGGEKSIRAGEHKSISILNKINKYKPDLLLVAYGAPWQEKWIYRHLTELKVKVVMGVGGSFDYLTGRAKVPPEWISGAGLEWLWRLVHEPWRWRRQLRLARFLLKLAL
ncbi:hypothetical protein A3D85_03460 [Candidatus Amesbacteria bacterium RIFCSPHIGHO2_02_FULL_47_9]|uniref:Glycosyltransferase n=1 Tax=Candidatus Amesbacteria bacterium RIFCSPHIGHO2_01_FULL_48_32b TaxID=1797253 RepID=A0A1F4YF89_9BACT|nr:MAG: hypothetical protein A2876_03050 [Candidatus Amesbacteria bacterium RIFCSPHIGHO2_01_FULL_48_32b]OGD04758.1 MAG: hypothetical protein A3D85_03460 [Candidatus Amesbacteria bacterium RIFCSPHIGHO2_02_FULL_47_9]OGD07770.1 MAG: hypothetical protein A2899_01205 [Candidatus Amesbacteria bacterium RIFCSPLOWO2_01_FULL_49_25]